MYTINTIHDFLLDQGLISPSSLVFDDFEATSINRRNKNIQVTSLDKEANFLIKQVADTNLESAKTLKTEAEFYKYFNGKFPTLEGFLPETKFICLEDIVLVMKFHDGAMPLWKYYNEKTIDKFPQNTAKTIGKLLGSFHNYFSQQEILEDETLSFLKEDMPFIFQLHKPHPSKLSHISSGGHEFIKHLQSQGDIMLLFNESQKSWVSNSLIHGDIKLDNFIVLNPEHENSTQLKLVDWEMAQIGDYAWDLAGIFNDFIFWWVISMPDNLSPEEMVQKAKFPFNKLHPAINIYWTSYCETRGFSEEDSNVLLKKVIFYSGFRVLQTSFEISSKFDAIPSIARVLLNMGKSILKNPLFAQRELFNVSIKATI